jgi:hypothetical protein
MWLFVSNKKKAGSQVLRANFQFKFWEPISEALEDPKTIWEKNLSCYSLADLSNYGAFTLDVKSEFNENLGGILGGT